MSYPIKRTEEKFELPSGNWRMSVRLRDAADADDYGSAHASFFRSLMPEAELSLLAAEPRTFADEGNLYVEYKVVGMTGQDFAVVAAELLLPPTVAMGMTPIVRAGVDKQADSCDTISVADLFTHATIDASLGVNDALTDLRELAGQQYAAMNDIEALYRME